MNDGIAEADTLNSLIADEGASDDAGELILLRNRVPRGSKHCQNCDYAKPFHGHLSSTQGQKVPGQDSP